MSCWIISFMVVAFYVFCLIAGFFFFFFFFDDADNFNSV